MKRLIGALLLVCLLGCDAEVKIDFGDDFGSLSTLGAPNRPDITYPTYQREMPTVNLEQALRQSNWEGSEDEGSCVHATMISLFRWQGREDLAKKWRATYENGERYDGLAAKFDMEGVRYAYTWNQKDVKFLEWACATRRGCGVTVRGGKHMVALVYLDKDRAGLLDNNNVGSIKWVSRQSFLSEWRNSYSWAVTPIMGSPAAPLPSEGIK